jgi:hypothetical protein
MARRGVVAALGLALCAALVAVMRRGSLEGRASLAMTQLEGSAFGPGPMPGEHRRSAPTFMYDNDGERVPWAVTAAATLAGSLQVHPGTPGTFRDVWGLKKLLKREGAAAHAQALHGAPGQAARAPKKRDPSTDGLEERPAEYRETISNLREEMRASEQAKQTEETQLHHELERQSNAFDAQLAAQRAEDARRTKEELADQARRFQAEQRLRAKSAQDSARDEEAGLREELR